MSNIRHVVAVFTSVMLLSSPLSAATFTVSKDGRGKFTSIREAINAAGPGDEVIILDTAVYEEQVTIDSTKNGLTLRSNDPRALIKPTIRFLDTINVGPTTAAEALVDSLITFDRNGALQVLGAGSIRIEGIAVDGGGVYPFGKDAIWEGRYAMQHGNGAITLWIAGDVIIRDCDIGNAYFGICVKDRNEGGVFAHPNPSDIDANSIIPFSAFARTGNHLIEYNRIHNNSVGMYFESTWDMGSAIRYNLFYENHHPTAAIANKVKGLTSEGGNQAGGALMFKDHLVSPLAIYNNTFWHNSILFLGNWKSGGQHLIFNNIYAGPNEYWGDAATTFASFYEMSKCFTNRMHNCVYAAQEQAPTALYTIITPALKLPQPGETYVEGALITPFPAVADVRWVETQFLSTDPSSDAFLFPDWNDTNVQNHIVDKGWEAAGVKDPDGSRADLGAIPKAGGRPVDVVTIRPTIPVELAGSWAKIGFNVTPRIGTIIDPKIIYSGIVTKLDTSDNFGSDYKPIIAGNIQKIQLETQAIAAGANTMDVPVPATGDFAFLEMIVEGIGSDGKPFTSAAGFIPYRKLDYVLDVAVLDKSGGAPIGEVRVGTTVVLSVKARNGTVPFTNKIDPTDVKLLSRLALRDPAGAPVTAIPGGVAGTAEMEVVFTGAPASGVEHVMVAGRWISEYKVTGFVGASNAITILPDLTGIRPIVKTLPQSGSILRELIDLHGRVVRRAVMPRIVSGHDGPFTAKVGRGIYLVRTTDAATGKVTMGKRVVLGR